MTDNSNVTTRNAQAQNSSTLIEFPGVNRNRPAWRKELSERFREIQQRRSRDPEDEAAQRRPSGHTVSAHDDNTQPVASTKSSDATAKQLGLVPTPDEPELNPLVAAALRRIERANRPSPPVARQGSGRAHAATAAARVIEEELEQLPESTPQTASPEHNESQTTSHAKRPARRADRPEAEEARPSTLVVVQSKQTAKAESTALDTTVIESKPSANNPAPESTTVGAIKKPETYNVSETVTQSFATSAQSSATPTESQSGSRQPRHLTGVLDEFWLERQGIELLPKVATIEVTYDDRAPRTKRLAASLVDLLAVAFLSAPFAAAIELTISNWSDPRVSGSMALIVGLVMFLYHTCSVALAGRTLGMSLRRLHVVDAGTASVPTTGQCMRRAFFYILSLATLGLGLLYSLFDAEGRAAHDILSGTVVVKK
jgi:uncharacterized RDD family membrane protein YckC